MVGTPTPITMINRLQISWKPEMIRELDPAPLFDMTRYVFDYQGSGPFHEQLAWPGGRSVNFPFEPFGIKVVEPVKRTTREERDRLLREAGYNLFHVPCRGVAIDLLTDSGTSAMSDSQWAGMMLGDESYAGSKNYHHFETVVRGLFGYRYVIPTHQGRAAEHVLFSTVLKPACACRTTFILIRPGPTSSTRRRRRRIWSSKAYDPHCELPFKGNMDVARLEGDHQAGRAFANPFVLITITNNSAGGQPVSMANIRATDRC